MSVTVYGIPNCDTVKKARVWLDGQGIAYTFHDYKKQGADPAKLAAWCKAAGWEKVLNRAGTTFRKPPELERQGPAAGRAVALADDHSSARAGIVGRVVAGAADQLVRAGPADEDDVVDLLEEVSAMQLSHQGLVDLAAGEVEAIEVAIGREASGLELVGR